MQKPKYILLLIFLTLKLSLLSQPYFTFGSDRNPQGDRLLVDKNGFVAVNSRGQRRRLLPVMGEIHYSRLPEKEWKRELLKMKAGGITMVSTYVFWNHHESEQGKWSWEGNRNLRRFIETCRECGLPLVLRIGPFCHGEVYLGGIPEWIIDKSREENFKIRSSAPSWLKAVKQLYSQIFSQSEGLLWKDGGPVVGIQIENECRGPWQYYQSLKDLAVEVGFDVPFYTRTGWPKLNGKETFGQMLPLFGDYADGFWDRTLDDMPGEYSEAFKMRKAQVSATIATETFSSEEMKNEEEASNHSGLSYPYLTCELGGGMMTSYHRRINIFDRDAFALAVCKVGSGSNLPGYYMYHGGTNPYNPEHSMAELQNSKSTNYNDMPYMSYDFQSPLGEVGQVNTSYHLTRLLHQFLADWGEELSLQPARIISDTLAVRGRFRFVNTYVRMKNEEGKTYFTIDNVLAQPFCKIDKQTYYIAIPGITPKDLKGVLTMEEAMRAFKIDNKLYFSQHGGVLFKQEGKIVEEWWRTLDKKIRVERTRTSDKLRTVKMGAQKVAEMPTEADFAEASTWNLQLPPEITANADNHFLLVTYKGDVARVYADGKLVEDNFWNGKPFYVRASNLVGKKVEIKILPMSPDYPIYLQKAQREALSSSSPHSQPSLLSVQLVERVTELAR